MLEAAQLERIRDLAGSDGRVALEDLQALLGERSLSTELLKTLARHGITVSGAGAYDNTSGVPALTLYMNEVTRHRLLAPHEEKDLARELDARRGDWASAVFRWPRARRELTAQALANADALGNFLLLGDVDPEAVRRRLRVLAHGPVDASSAAALGAYRWQEAVVRPYAAELRYRYRLIQREEVFIRQRCLMFAGVSSAVWARHALELFADGWLPALAADAQLRPEVAAALDEQTQPARQRALATAAHLQLSVDSLRAIDRDIRRAEHDVRRARNALIRANLRLVVAVARRSQNRGVLLDDLIQEGNIGLMRAIDKFDWRLGYKLSTYATWWIRQAVGRAVQTSGRTVRLPGQVADLVRRVGMQTERLVQRHGREPSVDELAAALDIDVARVREIQALTPDAASLDVAADDGWSPFAGLSDDRVDDPDAAMELEVTQKAIEHALAELPPTAALVVRLRFGLGTGEHSLVDIARQLGCSRARVRGLEREALAVLKERFENLDDWI